METKIIPVSFGFVKAFLVKGDRTIILDAGLKGSTKKILKAMAANGIKPSDVSLLLATHTHVDHIGGLKALKDAIGAPVAVHESEAGFLAEGKSVPVAHRPFLLKLLSGITGMEKLDRVQPEVIIKGRLDLAQYGVDGFVFPTPGHTDGSVTLVTAQGDAIVGDMVRGSKIPAFPGIYTDMETMKASVRLLREAKIKNVYNSHGSMFPIEDVLKLGEANSTRS